MSIFRKLVNQQVALSKHFDEIFLPKKFLIDGNQDYINNFLPSMLEKIPIRSTVYDVDCGKNPAISIEVKQKLQAKVIGIDLSANELLQAPAGTLLWSTKTGHILKPLSYKIPAQNLMAIGSLVLNAPVYHYKKSYSQSHSTLQLRLF